MNCFAQKENQSLSKKDFKLIHRTLKVYLLTIDKQLLPDSYKKIALNEFKMLIKKVEKQL